MERNLWTSCDPLAEALHSLRTDGAFYCRSELSAPWGLQMPTMHHCLWFHAVIAGGCQLQTHDHRFIDVVPGDFVLVPHGRGHIVCSHPSVNAELVTELPQEMISSRYSLLQYGPGGPKTTLLCGVIRLETPFFSDLDSLLPPLIHLDAQATTESGVISNILRLLAAEAKALQPGGEAIITRLADILVVHTLREWIRRNAHRQTGLLAAIQDEQIGRILIRVHKRPEDQWTIESLAAVAGMSRSGFCARFRQLINEAPMQYITRLRMRAAERILRTRLTTVGELAQQFGYQSEAAFNRAFKRWVGCPPGAIKRAAAAASFLSH